MLLVLINMFIESLLLAACSLGLYTLRSLLNICGFHSISFYIDIPTSIIRLLLILLVMLKLTENYSDCFSLSFLQAGMCSRSSHSALLLHSRVHLDAG